MAEAVDRGGEGRARGPAPRPRGYLEKLESMQAEMIITNAKVSDDGSFAASGRSGGGWRWAHSGCRAVALRWRRWPGRGRGWCDAAGGRCCRVLSRAICIWCLGGNELNAAAARRACMGFDALKRRLCRGLCAAPPRCGAADGAGGGLRHPWARRSRGSIWTGSSPTAPLR